MKKVVLVIAAHTDDEVLGCGGTIARHVAEGDVVYAVFMADGVSSRTNTNQADLTNRHSAAEQARKILGVRGNYYLGLRDNQLDSLPLIEIIQQIEPIINKIQPNIIYTHHHGDLNIDHRITLQAVLTACRPVPGSYLQEIYSFEVMSSTGWSVPDAAPFLPNHFVNISDQLDTKMDALRAYDVEMRDAPHSRSFQSLNHLAHYRGHSVGMVAAEAFMTLRFLR
jgi:LmbE family N-acetylglucosaminyl deacetylase